MNWLNASLVSVYFIPKVFEKAFKMPYRLNLTTSGVNKEK